MFEEWTVACPWIQFVRKLFINLSVKVTTTGTTAPSTIQTKPTKGCGGKPADVVFALDSSSSIWGPDFDTQLRFIQDIVGVFDISPETTHVGLLTFGSAPENHFQLDKFNAEQDVSTWIILSGSEKYKTEVLSTKCSASKQSKIRRQISRRLINWLCFRVYANDFPKLMSSFLCFAEIIWKIIILHNLSYQNEIQYDYSMRRFSNCFHLSNSEI